MNFRSVNLALALAVATPTLPAYASPWPDSIFDGASPQVLAEVHAHHLLVSEAEGYLSPCTGMDADTERGCLFSQYNFVMDYIYAVYNEYSSQTNIAYLLSGDGNPPRNLTPGDSELGINPDPTLGCAWRIMAIIGGNAGFDNDTLDNYKQDCLALSADAQQSANDIANSQLMLEITSHLKKGDAPFDIYTGAPAGKSPN